MIRMQQNFDKLIFLTGEKQLLENIQDIPVRKVFDERVIDFLGDLSKQILRDARTKQYPDVVTYAFWIRRKSVLAMKEKYQTGQLRIGRGMAFHIAPSNVAVSFALSFTAALLAGNMSVVRVSNKRFVQVDIITDAIKKLTADVYSDFKPYLVLVRYEHDEEVTQALSDRCDVRIIWGGNQTIELIRKAVLPPRAIELTFADRHSIAILNADEYLKGNAIKIAKDFYLDTYYSDQNACSAPRIVVWMGQKVEEAQERFWGCLQKLVDGEYEFATILAVDKWNSLCSLAANQEEGVHLQSCSNKVMRVKLDCLKGDLMNYKMGGGYFFEYRAEELNEIMPILGKACQTIAYYGIHKENVEDLLFQGGVRGMDRIVPFGHTMDLSIVWDGYNMVESMSRIVDSWEVS